MEFKKLDKALLIDDDRIVRLKMTGNVTEIMSADKISAVCHIKKIDKDNYIDLDTGEVKQFVHNTSRFDDVANVKKSLSYGRDVINTNCVDVRRCRWVTLTYRDNMQDPARLYFDFKNFNKRARLRLGHYEYITAAEPQQRGAWHLHCILIFDDVAPFLDNKLIADLWGQGFVNIQKIDDVDNIGAYLTAYMTDIELIDNSSCSDSDIKQIDFNGNLMQKKFIKGARLKMYPVGFHIFRYSQGIKKPDISFTEYKIAKEKAGSGKPTFSKSLELFDIDSGFKNTLTYEFYNKSRK